jgi:hypothetical protein
MADNPPCGLRGALAGCGGVRALREGLKSGRRSVDTQDALERAAPYWRPELVDVVASMLSDVSGWEGAGLTFREWLDEGLASDNAADALDCYNAIVAEYRFLSRVFGSELGAACELAGRL